MAMIRKRTKSHGTSRLDIFLGLESHLGEVRGMWREMGEGRRRGRGQGVAAAIVTEK